MYEVIIRSSFETTHALSHYRGSDELPHTHRFACEVAFASSRLDPSGCAVDFADADAALEPLLKELSAAPVHEHPDFRGESPSAETIARWIFRRLAPNLSGKGCRVARVTVWEDERHGASYAEP